MQDAIYKLKLISRIGQVNRARAGRCIACSDIELAGLDCRPDILRNSACEPGKVIAAVGNTIIVIVSNDYAAT